MKVREDKKLIIFDVDGVLLDGKLGGFKDILALLGKREKVEIIDEEYQRRKHKGPWGLEQLAALYKGYSQGKLTKTAERYCRKNLVPGAKETIPVLKKQGYLVGAISSSPQFILQVLKNSLTLNFIEGTKLEFSNDAATGKMTRKVDRYQKARILEEKKQQLDLETEQITVVGDSITDLPMAKEAGRFIAFNAKKPAAEKANAVINQKDLKILLEIIK